MSLETQALKNRIKRTESDIEKLQSELQELLERMERLENPPRLMSAKEASEKISEVLEQMEHERLVKTVSKDKRIY